MMMAPLRWMAPVLLMATVASAEQAVRPVWSRMVAVAKQHQLPKPGPAARLALVHAESWSLVGNASHPHDPANYQPGWVLEELPDGKVRVLTGTQEKVLEPREAKEPLWHPFSTEARKPKLGGYVPDFDSTETFAVAIQCAVRGDLRRADALWDAFASVENISGADTFDAKRFDGDRSNAELLFAEMLFDWREGQAAGTGANLKEVEAGMADLLKEYPTLADERRQQLLASVRASNEAKPAAEGSVEALLIAYGAYKPEPYRPERAGEREDDPKSRIIRMGFEAIPELLRLKDDPRMTSLRSSGFMRVPSAPLLLGALAREILCELLPGSARGQQVMFDPPREGDFAAAWEKAKHQNEASFYLENALGKSAEGALEIRDGAVSVIAVKAPDRLEELIANYHRQAGPEDTPGMIAAAVAWSELPVEKKVALLGGLAVRGSFSSRRYSCQVLATVSPQAAKEPAMILIDQLPKDVSEPYWTASVAAVSRVILEIDDEDIWQAFLEKARRASAGLRMEWMNPFNYAYLGDRQEKRRLAFLAAFLDDREVRDDSRNKERYEGPCAAFTFPKIAVRDFVAMQMASILEIDPLHQPDSTWTATQWTALREKVAKRLTEQGIEAMK